MIDLDYAADVVPDTLVCKSTGAPHRTGTLSFIAIDILRAITVRTFTTMMLNPFSMCLYGLVSTTATKKATILQPMPPIIMIAFGLLIV